MKRAEFNEPWERKKIVFFVCGQDIEIVLVLKQRITPDISYDFQFVRHSMWLWNQCLCEIPRDWNLFQLKPREEKCCSPGEDNPSSWTLSEWVRKGEFMHDGNSKCKITHINMSSEKENCVQPIEHTNFFLYIFIDKHDLGTHSLL